MVNRNFNLEMDIADSSSESGIAESVTDDDQLPTDGNSLIFGNEVNSDINGPLPVIYPNIEEDFKSEWVDVLPVSPFVCDPF